jgi:hypothetical protein
MVMNSGASRAETQTDSTRLVSAFGLPLACTNAHYPIGVVKVMIFAPRSSAYENLVIELVHISGAQYNYVL